MKVNGVHFETAQGLEVALAHVKTTHHEVQKRLQMAYRDLEDLKFAYNLIIGAAEDLGIELPKETSLGSLGIPLPKVWGGVNNECV